MYTVYVYNNKKGKLFIFICRVKISRGTNKNIKRVLRIEEKETKKLDKWCINAAHIFYIPCIVMTCYLFPCREIGPKMH
jgi:hypothetical protein